LQRQATGTTVRTDVDVAVLARFLELVLEGLVSHLAMGLPVDELGPVLDLVEGSVRVPRAGANGSAVADARARSG
jgi:hypothetical protein